MALHNQLPIYKQGYDLLTLAADVQQHMPRSFKASLGNKIHCECIEILMLIGRANAARGMQRAPHIVALVERVEVVTLLLRLSHDKRFISPKLWACQFTHGAGHIYHYPNVEPKIHADFMSSKSIGKYFGQHIKALPFAKYEAPKTEAPKAGGLQHEEQQH